MSDNLYWRSPLFSALGAGFEQDKTVRDGIHLRWTLNQKLGLPIEHNNGATGVFRVYHLRENSGSLLLQDPLSVLATSNPDLTIYSTLNSVNGSGLDNGMSTGTRFRRQVDIPRKQLINRYLTMLRWVNPYDENLTAQQLDLVTYLKSVLQRMMPESVLHNWFAEIGEVCAADIKVQINNPNDGQHAWIRGYDRYGNMVAEDWVGRENGAPKDVARLFGPNIYFFKIDHVISSGQANQETVWWMFCDDYCKSNIWLDIAEPRFKITDGTYTEDFIRDILYRPFTKVLTWDDAARHLDRELVQNQFVQEMVDQPDTYQMLKHRAQLFFGLPEDQPPNDPKITMPVLGSLLQSSIDPIMARILGLSHYLDSGAVDHIHQVDYKVEAYLPFFNEDNLLALREKIEEIFAAQNISFNFDIETLTGLTSGTPNDAFIGSTALCGLVLNPTLSQKPDPIIPSIPQTIVRVEDVPAQEGLDRENGIMDIFVDSRIQIEKSPTLTEPYLNPVAYEVERNLGSNGFVNVIEEDDAGEDEPDILDGMGILPPIYLPQFKKDADLWEVRDDFKLQVTTDDTVQYQIKGFDIFGRPSAPEVGTTEAIPVPCYPPLRPGQLLANLNAEGNDLNLELHFSVTDLVPHLRATQEKLEIAVYPLDQGSSGAAEAVTWAGNKSSRTFNVNYLPNGAFLDTATLALGCADLSWVADEINWNATASGSCDADFPIDTNTLSLAQFASPMNDEAETDQRLYRLFAKVGEIGGLPPGQHRWCVRIRVVGRCDAGSPVYSEDVCIGTEHVVAPPLPAVLQPVQQRIPESTYADPAGDAFYYLDLQEFFPAGTQHEPLVNVYQTLLTNLTDEPETVVDGDFFAGVGLDGVDGFSRAQTLGKSNRVSFQKVTDVPVALTADQRFVPVPVRGDLEEYYVVGVIGCDETFTEKDWQQAGIVLYKTPQPIPAPLMSFGSASYNMAKNPVEVTLNFRAEFAMAHNPAHPLPKVQIVRHDLSTGNSRFIGEALGVEGSPEGAVGEEVYPFAFTLKDSNPKPYRRYRYEAILMQHGEKHGKYVKSGQTADCNLLIPTKGTVSPFLEPYGLLEEIENGSKASFEFSAGDYELSLTRILTTNGESERYTGRVTRGELHGLPNSLLDINRSTGAYTLTFEDNTVDPSLYTLRIWQGQQKVWSQKAVKNE